MRIIETQEKERENGLERDKWKGIWMRDERGWDNVTNVVDVIRIMILMTFTINCSEKKWVRENEKKREWWERRWMEKAKEYKLQFICIHRRIINSRKRGMITIRSQLNQLRNFIVRIYSGVWRLLGIDRTLMNVLTIFHVASVVLLWYIFNQM